MANFACFVREMCPEAGREYTIGIEFLKRWGLYLAVEGFRKQSLTDYVGTVRDYFVERDRIQDERNFQKNFDRAVRLRKLAALKREIGRADPVWGPGYEELEGKEKAMANFMTQTWVRRSSAIQAKRHWREGDESELGVFLADWKCLDTGESRAVKTGCACYKVPPMQKGKGQGPLCDVREADQERPVEAAEEGPSGGRPEEAGGGSGQNSQEAEDDRPLLPKSDSALPESESGGRRVGGSRIYKEDQREVQMVQMECAD